jgi:hypothetical protein
MAQSLLCGGRILPPGSKCSQSFVVCNPTPKRAQCVQQVPFELICISFTDVAVFAV